MEPDLRQVGGAEIGVGDAGERAGLDRRTGGVGSVLLEPF
jgi:hypothetical protein